MTSDYAPTPVEDFLDPDDPTLFPGSHGAIRSTWPEIGNRQTFARTGKSSSTASARPPLRGPQRSLGHHRPARRVTATSPNAEGDQLAADLSMFTGEPTLAAGFAAEPTSLRLPAEDVRRVVATAAELGDLLLRTMVTRRGGFRVAAWVHSA